MTSGGTLSSRLVWSPWNSPIVVSTCWKAIRCSRRLCRAVNSSSPVVGSSTMKAPAIPLATWRATDPCLCGWYQWVPGDWFCGMRNE